ncbi:hypothetical protein AGMMS49957_00360 [Synergistales bacterium]|nr:hypothetical protein AGMMS49957_00360 [Synergistales bacterium]
MENDIELTEDAGRRENSYGVGAVKNNAKYSLAFGQDIKQAAPGEFVLKNGSPVWGQVTEELTQGREDTPVGELRVQVGDVKHGLIHAKNHEADIQKSGFKGNAEDYIDHVFNNATTILPVGDGKHFMVAERDGEKILPSATIAW